MLQSRWATKPDPAEEHTESTNPPAKIQPDAVAEVKAAFAPAAVNVAYEPAYNDPSIDPFAQTASTDDLFFDDDITPIAEPVIEQNPLENEARTTDFVPDDIKPPIAPQPHLPLQIPREPRNSERGSRGRGRGRSRGRGRGGLTTDIRETGEKKAQSISRESESLPFTASAIHTEGAEPSSPPSAPTEPKEKPAQSVRGDRTLTGGAARTRLTEEQLNAKLANMRSKNEALQTAHARAEADLAKFEAREAVLKKQDVERKKVIAEKQKAERQNRQQMMGEREKNRQRKLNAQGGREWDFEKEEGFSGTGEERRRGATRGAYGGIAPSRLIDGDYASEQVEEPNSQQYFRGRGRGRGDRSNRGGRATRIDHASRQPEHKRREDQQPPSTAEFPELPSSTAPAPKDGDTPKVLDFPIKSKTSDTKKSEPERPDIKKQESFGLPSPMEKGTSWADEVGS
ncbi:hypothetical protein BKA66DRAFT_437878 [Pyrenochaeta sp. MPI-SDFR-AT-0127]|nr:hypothetical protein BKA66DRAFT_437878 [Pyrenochaeta sp. MPI-SDFR-AT-0127]